MRELLEVAVSNAVAAALLALLAASVGLVCRRPALGHALWLLVLLKLVTPPLVQVPVPWPTGAPPSTESAEVEVSAPPAPLAPVSEAAAPEEGAEPLPEEAVEVLADAFGEAPPAPALEQASLPPLAPRATAAPGPLWPWLLGAGWLAGSLIWFVLAIVRVRRFQRALRLARLAPAELQERVAQLARRLRLKRVPATWLVPGQVAPMVWAMGGRPRLLLPIALFEQLSDEGGDTLLVHELAHLKRRDHWARVLEMFALGLYWWCPVVWYARRELREAEEQCCDAWVVATLPGAGRTYATALLDTLDFLSLPEPLRRRWPAVSGR